jgi:hypothetical protein
MIHRVVLALLGAVAVAVVSPCAAQSAAGSDSSASATNQASGAPQGAPAPGAGNLASSSPAPPAAAPAPAASASATSSTSADSAPGPSPEFVKKARSEGFKPKVQKNGETMFCRKDASMNTRLETEKCYSANQMESIIHQRQEMHDELARPRACAGAGCGSN